MKKRVTRALSLTLSFSKKKKTSHSKLATTVAAEPDAVATKPDPVVLQPQTAPVKKPAEPKAAVEVAPVAAFDDADKPAKDKVADAEDTPVAAFDSLAEDVAKRVVDEAITMAESETFKAADAVYPSPSTVITEAVAPPLERASLDQPIDLKSWQADRVLATKRSVDLLVVVLVLAVAVLALCGCALGSTLVVEPAPESANLSLFGLTWMAPEAPPSKPNGVGFLGVELPLPAWLVPEAPAAPPPPQKAGLNLLGLKLPF